MLLLFMWSIGNKMMTSSEPILPGSKELMMMIISVGKILHSDSQTFRG